MSPIPTVSNPSQCPSKLPNVNASVGLIRALSTVLDPELIASPGVISDSEESTEPLIFINPPPKATLAKESSAMRDNWLSLGVEECDAVPHNERDLARERQTRHWQSHLWGRVRERVDVVLVISSSVRTSDISLGAIGKLLRL